jgi:hypothetical protein
MTREYCKDCKKATVKYKFPGKDEKAYISRKCPFTIEIGQPDPGYWTLFKPEGFTLEFTSFLEGNKFYSQLYAYKDKGLNYEAIAWNGDYLPFGFQGLAWYVWKSGRMDMTVRHDLVAPEPYKTTFIKVRHNGLLLFQDGSNGQPAYSVECEQQCKEGELKIDNPQHPGYWCLTKQQQLRLQGIIDRTRRIQLK